LIDQYLIEEALRGLHMKMGTAVVVLALLGFLLCSNIHAQHPAIYLLDKDGDIIDPISGENQDKPFSTAMTCGMCHDYEEITSGYHFQMGWDVISDDFGDSTRHPWNLSNGFMGKWYPYTNRQLARKHNSHADQIDLTVYDFVGHSAGARGMPPCGACHPGGGGLEYDREGNRYDEFLTDYPEYRDSLDGDYYQSNWDKSGVVEADCFVCHFPGYDFDERVSQLQKGNYRWAVVAGSGIGFVDGSVDAGDEPVVQYNKRFFNDDGTVSLDMTWPPPSDNCIFCHGRADIRKRGFSWNDIHNADVHNQQGVSCAACHPSGPEHNFAKGDANVSTVADHLDNTMLDCRGCHMQGVLGASVPKHASVRPSHIEAISCEACHVPRLGRSAALGVDHTSGEHRYITNPRGSDGFGQLAEWHPTYERRDKGVLYPLNIVQAIWWANLSTDSIMHPLFEKEAKAAWEKIEAELTDDNEDDHPEINTPAEIELGLKALAETLVGNQRFDQIHPVLLKGGKAWHLDESGKVAVLKDSVHTSIDFSINHNVAPARQALGNGGCQDCHHEGETFFKGKRTVDLYDELGNPVLVSNGRFFGCNPWIFAVNSFHQKVLSPVVSFGIILVIFLVTAHYHRYGPKRVPFVPNSGEVPRFSIPERAIHNFRLISFALLAFTGLILAFNWVNWQELFFSSPRQMLWVHIISGLVFIVTSAAGMAAWFEDALFASYDIEWVRRIGGYLGYKGEVLSGRFNAGQKMFYWYTAIFGAVISVTGLILTFKSVFPLSVICITSTVHNLTAFVLIAGVLSHAYLGTVANPGTWRVLVDGFVTREWAHHHHPLWLRKLIDEGHVESDDSASDSSDADKDQPESPSERKGEDQE